jgi:hypothetical protein
MHIKVVQSMVNVSVDILIRDGRPKVNKLGKSLWVTFKGTPSD